jgi:pSer/pThr/pTyr-binding forkhead associated (FHA) protein
LDGAASAWLVAKRFGAIVEGEKIPLTDGPLLVGRFDPETGPVDLDLSDSPEAVHVSRHHAELARGADGRWMVRDLGSTNGVFVKSSADSSFGPRIVEPKPLSNGDEVAFGNARFVFKVGE